MNETESRPKITLEDLLQLKRAERPSAEFWPEFERTLRAKQLAAIVESRPWWRNWTFRKTLVRVGMPLGATAAVAMTLSSFRVAAIKPSTEGLAHNMATVQAPLAMGESVSAQENHSFPVRTDGVASSEAIPQSNVQADQPLVAATETTGSASTGSAEQLLASGKAAGQALAQFVGLMDIPSSQMANARPAVVEPLTQVATPRDNRRTRLLAYSVSFDPHAADSSDAVRSRERITHRLSDDAIYDSITRLGLSADRVSIKF